MKNTLIAIVALLSFASIAAAGISSEELAALKQKLSDLDPALRRDALDQLEREERPMADANNILPLLSSALADQDQQVRARAAAFLAIIAFSTQPKLHSSTLKGTDLRSCPPLKAALSRAFNDPDEETRKNALAAYALTFEVPAEVQDQLTARFASERQNSVMQAAILEALMIDGTPTPPAKALLRLAGSPDGAAVVAQITQDSKSPPSELLPVFANQFSTSRDGNHKALFARAIAKFGTAAKPYLPSLTQAAQLESDNYTRKAIIDAISMVEAAK